MCSPISTASCLIWIFTLPGVVDTPAVSFKPDYARLVRQAQPAPPPPQTVPASSGKEFFVSWGYNGNNYGKSDIHFTQSSLGNDFTLHNVRVHDSKAWTDLFDHALTVPQYNLRFGVFLDEKWGLELAMDHIKWIVTQDQQVRMTGTLNNAAVDADVALTEDVLKYQLNNGANPVFVNLLRRFPLAGKPRRTGFLSLLLKAGGGFAMPHTENTLFGVPNEKGFQFFHGWNLDAGAAVRAHLWRFIYFELEDKLVYARYFGVNVDQGKAGHSVKTNEWSFHFGVSIW